MFVFKCFLSGVIFVLLSSVPAIAQEKTEEKEKSTREVSEEIESRLEEMTANNEDEVTEDESYLQDLDFYSRHPLNLNTVDRETLEGLNILSPAQIDHFFTYRNLLGRLVSIYEVQAIPGWDVATIRKLLPFITVSTSVSVASFTDRFRGGESMLLARYTRVLEKSEGFLRDGSDGRSHYPGNPDKYLLRYKYRFKNTLQYGLTAEKDAGEQFFKGHQKYGFDFYSAHFYARDLGIVKAVTLGDFAVNFGQGLIQWQSLSFAGPGEALFIKKQGDKLRPYVSAGEVEFNRGIGFTLAKNNWEGTAFVSFRNMDATLDKDTMDFATSIRLSGLHRTESEINGANLLNQLSYGGNLQYAGRNFRIGFNTVQYQFAKSVQKDNELYKKFISPGKYAANYSIDYSYTHKNLHFFGETASDANGDLAFVNGLAVSANRYLDVGMLHRNISYKYLALYGDAFTQSSSPVNENGFYTGINIRPNDVIRIDAYADIFKFPWLRYRVDAPSVGAEYMLQFYYRPVRGADLYVKYRSTNKAINTTEDAHATSVVENKTRQNLRMQMSMKVSADFTFRARTESVWYDQKAGFMIYSDVLYKPMMKRFSGNIRLQYFETDDYDTRLYAFESDVLYSYSIPMVYGKGFRYYLNLRYNLFPGVSLWTRLAQTRYADRDVIGSGLDKIEGNTKTELKAELVWRF